MYTCIYRFEIFQILNFRVLIFISFVQHWQFHSHFSQLYNPSITTMLSEQPEIQRLSALTVFLFQCYSGQPILHKTPSPLSIVLKCFGTEASNCLKCVGSLTPFGFAGKLNQSCYHIAKSQHPMAYIISFLGLLHIVIMKILIQRGIGL